MSSTASSKASAGFGSCVSRFRRCLSIFRNGFVRHVDRGFRVACRAHRLYRFGHRGRRLIARGGRGRSGSLFRALRGRLAAFVELGDSALIRSKAALERACGLAEAICPQAASMAPTWESSRSQIRPSAPISRQRQEISLMIRAPLRTGARFSSSARPSTAAAAVARPRRPRGGSRPRPPAARHRAAGWLLRGQGVLDPRHRIEHHAGVGVAVALGVFAEKPAAARGLHEGLADRLIVLLARQARAGGDRR